MISFRFKPRTVIAAIIFASFGTVQAGEITVDLRQVTPERLGEVVGEVQFRDHEFGLLVVPNLQGLNPGPHGAHIHEHPDCGLMKMHGKAVPGGAAGGHFDPHKSGKHGGPYGEGHLGDLPNLIVEENGNASIPVVAPRLKVADIRSRALMIHAGADHYMDHGSHMHGKGGMRMYCGAIP